MSPITCIIVDDEPLAVKLLESFVTRTPQLQLEHSFTDSVEALTWLKEHPVNLAFMDIQMPDLNGMELSHMLPEGTKIIFTTAFKEYAFESYEVNAVDFLLKPIRYNKFIAAVEKAERLISLESKVENVEGSPKKTMFIRVDGELRQVNFEHILYVEGMKDYVRFHVEGESHPLTTHMTMKAVEDTLPTDTFMRINRSYIVRLDKIRTVDRNLCVYIGDEIIRVTDAYREAFENYCSGNC
ncbi:LytTR family DNA-binding domain-containing protein [Prevotella sp. tf2-5]|jgi:DNA-binding LytR/AlgR family response regulator|uniref:LytR/AlgR family response regulator transcription factor n=1 Tax=Prevotella sp. tf2-5 TaxID=1761889 RepID=UPI0008EB46C0|nr:LytTR family DNA-binding domain-containing protein [Prevotella sp. tf2-5]SFO59733.1 two component transcriptional regulator, LytTR family [Prevotella sp. tf2-5]